MKPTIFFDGGCPLCSREIGHYRRLDAGDRCRWVDISLEPEVLAAYRIDYGEAMARLHAVDAQGAVVSGVAAFVVTWRELPGYRHLARLLERFALVPFVDRIYVRFAAWDLPAAGMTAWPHSSRKPQHKAVALSTQTVGSFQDSETSVAHTVPGIPPPHTAPDTHQDLGMYARCLATLGNLEQSGGFTAAGNPGLSPVFAVPGFRL